ncbi:MAG: hypothetical protein K8R69_00415 [Deltaproteobacteria bacterium]|nr:hypothetical protein [Deltaproteobacteria bacterium]
MSNTVTGLHSNSEYYVDAYGETSSDYDDWENVTAGSDAPSEQDQYLPNPHASTQGPQTASMENYGDWENAGEAPPSEGEEFQQQCEALRGFINDDPELSPEQKKDYSQKLEKLKSGADLHPDSIDLYQNQLDALRENYELAAQYSPLANELAQSYGQDPGTVEEMAKKYGLDLHHLPNPANESVLKFLGELDPSLGESLKTAKTSVDDKTKKDAEMVQQAKDRNAMAVMSTGDMDSTDLSSYEYLLQAQTGSDPASLAMQDQLQKFQGDLQSALGALYGQASLSVDSELVKSAFDLKVPNLPDEVPELVPMAWDGRGTKGGGNFDRMTWPDWVSGYPKLEYTGKAKN